MGVMGWLRKQGIGRLVYLGWHVPRGFVKKCAREGPLNLWLTARGRQAMERTAWHLQAAQPTAHPNDAAVYFLTGTKFWYQTAFCAHSLLAHAGRPLRVVAIDDGTLSKEQAAALACVLPGLVVIWAEETQRRLDEFLPTTRFPILRQRRLVYPHLRKLTDVHAGGTGWKLVLDSDMLFHHRPEFLLDWLKSPNRPCHMMDVENAYGYSSGLMTELAGATIPDKLNVGVCGLRSDAIDWDRLEYWCGEMLKREGSHYLQEQALTAMLVADQSLAQRLQPPNTSSGRLARKPGDRPLFCIITLPTRKRGTSASAGDTVFGLTDDAARFHYHPGLQCRAVHRRYTPIGFSSDLAEGGSDCR